MHSKLTLLFLLACAGSAVAADGVLEINQTCAVNTGCFAGDVAGFPVTISAMGSYGLTSNLVVSNGAEGAIDVNAPDVTIDLRGFTVKGPGSCTGGGSNLSCGGSTATGIDGSASAAQRLRVHGGTVFGFGLGIRAVIESRISDVTVRYNDGDGIRTSHNARIDNCLADNNRGDGVEVGNASIVRGCSASGNLVAFRVGNDSVVDGNTATFNANQGYIVGEESKFGRNVSAKNGPPDECGGGICTERRRFYLTQDLHLGNDTLTACAAGFHMASFWEIRDTSKRAYDKVLGLVGLDSGDGPPTDVSAWIRTGWLYTNSPFSRVGEWNCSAWTSASTTNRGTAVYLSTNWDSIDDPVTMVSPWNAFDIHCGTGHRVWCVEDD
jgi:hypothetical protein